MSWIFGVFFFVLGAVLASFTGVISERLYTGQSWLAGRSRCNSCRRTLDARDLVPVLSWVIYRRRCRTCKARVPLRYALFEFLLGALFASSFVTFGLTPYFFVFLVVLVVLAFIVLYDLRHMVVPTMSSWLLIALAAICAVVNSASLMVAIISAIVIAAGFYALYFFSRGRAMGLGDTPVAFALSLVAGARSIDGVLFSFWIGAAVSIFILAVRRGGTRMNSEVPFVPFLAAGYLLAIFLPWNLFHF